MKYDAKSYHAESQETILQRESIVSQEVVSARYALEKTLVAHVTAGDYELAVRTLESFSKNPDDYADLSLRLPKDPDQRFRAVGQLLNTTLRVSLLPSRVPFLHLHTVATHMGNLLEQAPIEYLREEQILYRIIEGYCYFAGEFNNRHYSDPVTQITDYIALHIRDAITLNQIAEDLHYSAAYINRMLKKETRFSVIQYIKHARVTLAKSMLLFRELTVADVAVLAGYPDCNYFCRVFRQVEGMSPAQYREERKAGQAAGREDEKPDVAVRRNGQNADGSAV